MSRKMVIPVTVLTVIMLLTGCSNASQSDATPTLDAVVKPHESQTQTIVDNATITEAENDNGYFYEFGYFLEVYELGKSPKEMVELWKNDYTVPTSIVELTYDAKGDYTQLHFPGQETIYVSCKGEITPGVKMTGAEYDVTNGSILRTHEYYVWLEGNILYVSRDENKPEGGYFKKE